MCVSWEFTWKQEQKQRRSNFFSLKCENVVKYSIKAFTVNFGRASPKMENYVSVIKLSYIKSIDFNIKQKCVDNVIQIEPICMTTANYHLWLFTSDSRRGNCLLWNLDYDVLSPEGGIVSSSINHPQDFSCSEIKFTSEWKNRTKDEKRELINHQDIFASSKPHVTHISLQTENSRNQ